MHYTIILFDVWYNCIISVTHHWRKPHQPMAYTSKPTRAQISGFEHSTLASYYPGLACPTKTIPYKQQQMPQP